MWMAVAGRMAVHPAAPSSFQWVSCTKRGLPRWSWSTRKQRLRRAWSVWGEASQRAFQAAMLGMARWVAAVLEMKSSTVKSPRSCDQVHPRRGAGAPCNTQYSVRQDRARWAYVAAVRRASVNASQVQARGGGAASIARTPGR